MFGTRRTRKKGASSETRHEVRDIWSVFPMVGPAVAQNAPYLRGSVEDEISRSNGGHATQNGWYNFPIATDVRKGDLTSEKLMTRKGHKFIQSSCLVRRKRSDLVCRASK